MNIVVHTDNTIIGDESLKARAASEVEPVLARHEDRLVRVQVHLSNESAGRFAQNDIRCVMEAFMEGQSPAVATEHADTVNGAVRGTAQRLELVLDRKLRRPTNNTAHRHT